MRGTELARLARERLPGVGILLMSGYSAELLQPSSDSPLACELLAKPYTREQLAQAIARAMNSVRGPQQ
jgi:hypothetical protein